MSVDTDGKVFGEVEKKRRDGQASNLKISQTFSDGVVGLLICRKMIQDKATYLRSENKVTVDSSSKLKAVSALCRVAYNDKAGGDAARR